METGGKEKRGRLHAPDRDRLRGPLHGGGHRGPNGCGARAVGPAGAGPIVMGMGRLAGIAWLAMDRGDQDMLPPVSMVSLPVGPMARVPMLRSRIP